MVLYIMTMVTAYLRPSEPLRIQRSDFVALVAGVCDDWALILFPENRAARSKVMAKNETIDLSSHITPWYIKLVPLLAAGASDELISISTIRPS